MPKISDKPLANPAPEDLLIGSDMSDGGKTRNFLVSALAATGGGLHTHPWGSIVGTPTTLAGYGILDAYTMTEADLRYLPIDYAPSWAEITNTPTTLAGYGILDAYTMSEADARYLPIDYAPSWADITNTPTTLAGYGILDAYTMIEADLRYLPADYAPSWDDITNTPLTLAGYGIVNAYTKSEADARYLPIDYAPSWASITGKPTTIAGFGITDAYTMTQSDTNFATAGHAHATGVSGPGRFYYPDPLATADVNGYKQALTSPSSSAETTIVQTNSGTGDTLVATFITYPATGVGVTSLPSGISTRVFRVVCAGGNEVARLKVEMYISVAPYGPANETLVRSDYSPAFKGSTLIDLSWNFAAAAAVPMNATDRIVMRLYTARVAGPGIVTVTIYFDGTTHLSYLQTTLPAPVDILTARGDLLTRDAVNMTRLALGSSGTFLRSNASDPIWQALIAADIPTQLNATGMRASASGQAAGLYVPWVTGDASVTLSVGSANSGNTMPAIYAESFSSTGVIGVSSTANPIEARRTSAQTNTIATAILANHRSTGVIANGLGAGLLFQLQSTTTANQDAARVAAIWTDATHASRTSALTFATVNNAGALTDQMRLTSVGALLIRATALGAAGLFVPWVTGDTLASAVFGSSSASNNMDAINATTSTGIAIRAVSAALALEARTDDAGTTNVPNALRLRHNTTGTPAAGFGVSNFMSGHSSTLTTRDFATLVATWVDATDATRKARLALNVLDTASREGFRIEASGTAPMIGFLGANAVVRQTVSAAATDAATTQTLANSLRTALINLGLAA